MIRTTPFNQAVMNPPDFFNLYRARLDAALDSALLRVCVPESRLYASMRYSVLLGGKRVRPVLCLATAHAFEADRELAMDAACALELIHAYSLVHDDLPAMDDDDLRRGQPTCHIAFDHATAILAGDALQAAAFELISSTRPGRDSHTMLQLVHLLAQASGAKGMVHGQAIDLESVGKELTLDQLENMHQLKTGKLIEASVLMGATCGSASDTELNSLRQYASSLGLAFQVQDDILDVTGDTHSLGKQAGADIALNKPTYVSLLGLEGARSKLSDLQQECEASLQQLAGRDTHELSQIASYVVARSY